MADTQTPNSSARDRRRAASVIAQYIQDLAQPAATVPCASAA
jgi:hypothetical protein